MQVCRRFDLDTSNSEEDLETRYSQCRTNGLTNSKIFHHVIYFSLPFFLGLIVSVYSLVKSIPYYTNNVKLLLKHLWDNWPCLLICLLYLDSKCLTIIAISSVFD